MNRTDNEKPGMTAEEIRKMREQERMDSVYTEPPASRKALYLALNYLTACVTGAAILVGLYYLERLVDYLLPEILPYLWMIDDSAGFLTTEVTGILHLLSFFLIAFFFGFALDINYSRSGRPREVWGSQIRWILPAAFGSAVVYAAFRFLTRHSAFTPSGSLLSRVLYDICMLVIVPAANVLLFLVLPSAIIRMTLTVVSDTRERAELPLIIVSALVMTLALMGCSPVYIGYYGLPAALFALALCSALSVLYHRTNTIWPAILTYSGVSGLYLLLSTLADRWM